MTIIATQNFFTGRALSVIGIVADFLNFVNKITIYIYAL